MTDKKKATTKKTPLAPTTDTGKVRKSTKTKTGIKSTSSEKGPKSGAEPQDVQEWRGKVLKLIARVSSYMAIGSLIVTSLYQLWTTYTGLYLPESAESTILGVSSVVLGILQLGYFEARYRASNGQKGWLW